MKPPGAAIRANSPQFLVKKRVDSPMPIFVAMATSFDRSTGPGTPGSIGVLTPRARNLVIQM